MRLLTGDDTSWLNWATIAVWAVAIILIAAVSSQQRRQRRKLQRSVVLNEARAARQPDHPSLTT